MVRLRLPHCASIVTAIAILISLGAAVHAEDTSPPIAPAARKAVEAMGQTLAAGGFSFREQTIREYVDATEQPLHIFHTAEVTVRRPDRLDVDAAGDDGKTRIAFDGKTLVLYSVNANRYASLTVPGPIEQMLKAASEKMGMDFPLADFLAEKPAAAFLAGVSYGRVVGTASVDGVPCLHIFFMQPPGIELELWTEANDHALPRRLIVTYRSLPGEPRFIATMSDWKLGITPPDGAFEFQVPANATRVGIEQEKRQ
ncbi:MAG TPA: DUF2092 domain-containing protein [Acetobacteraceae bacterium]|nr:DUF2092 domain-containing protein [Acetobacteraceae bacterium]